MSVKSLRRLVSRWTVLWWLAFPPGIPAATLEQADIRISHGAYHYRFVAHLTAPVANVRAVAGDFERLARLNDDIVTSHLIERYDAQTLKRRLLLKHCLLIFCFDLDFVEHVDLLPNGDIATRIIPEESSFHYGNTVWRIEAIDDTHTRVMVEADQKPKFWIPPVIGSLLIERSFRNEATETVRNLETYANAIVQ